jgi:hypothetical protein
VGDVGIRDAMMDEGTDEGDVVIDEGTEVGVEDDESDESGNGVEDDEGVEGDESCEDDEGVENDESGMGVENDESGMGVENDESGVGVENDESGVGVENDDSGVGVENDDSGVGVENDDSGVGVENDDSGVGVGENPDIDNVTIDCVVEIGKDYLPLCPICREYIEGKCVSLFCSHKFHVDCLSPWIQNNNTCPCCRTIIERLPNGYGYGYQIGYFIFLRSCGINSDIKRDVEDNVEGFFVNDYKNNVDRCIDVSRQITKKSLELDEYKKNVQKTKELILLISEGDYVDINVFFKDIDKKMENKKESLKKLQKSLDDIMYEKV